MLDDHNTFSPCTCCREGRGTAECWNSAYELGRKATVEEIEGEGEGDVYNYDTEHASDCECAECGVQRALWHDMGKRTFDKEDVVRMMGNPFSAAIKNPQARQHLKALIVEAEGLADA